MWTTGLVRDCVFPSQEAYVLRTNTRVGEDTWCVWAKLGIYGTRVSCTVYVRDVTVCIWYVCGET